MRFLSYDIPLVVCDCEDALCSKVSPPGGKLWLPFPGFCGCPLEDAMAVPEHTAERAVVTIVSSVCDIFEAGEAVFVRQCQIAVLGAQFRESSFCGPAAILSIVGRH